ncbi:YitT family protein [Mycoplasmopsis felis]|uniref:YitT family protein n=1 Tax=Mycoplasmopsis felis TaxID=33923 RepID=UPI002AFF79DA|nr:YitT family protein [Mycoplasmopsis felis]WQQ03629.1 YitT family protein [Mycoplasmopsis felis]WQQ06007.1 YitT family protein [Mycoplasmopsis felis]WQQ11538.1 YitT family protein [Mycoplasmopsis felis]
MLPKEIKKEDLNLKKSTKKDQKNLMCYKNYCKTGNSLNLELNNNELSKDELSNLAVQERSEKIKYKMGKHLLNNKDASISLKNIVKRYWKKILLIFIAAFIFNAGIQVFLNRAETIPSGVTGIPTLLQYSFPVIKPYFALIYLACNIPLFLIFGWRIKRSFVILTLCFMVCQIITNFFFTSKIISESINEFITFTDSYKPYTNWSDIIYSIVGALFIAFGISLSWKAGGSTGGTDIIAYYFSMKSKKSVGHILSIIGVCSAILFLFIFSFIKPNYLYEEPVNPFSLLNEEKFKLLNSPSYNGVNLNSDTEIMERFEWLKNKHNHSKIYFGMRELTTFLYILVVNLFIDLIYPKYKKVSLTIISSDPQKILAYFKLINYWHSYRIERYKSGYTNKQSVKIETVMLLLETPNILYDLKLIDSNIWISISTINKVIGKFNTEFVEH